MAMKHVIHIFMLLIVLGALVGCGTDDPVAVCKKCTPAQNVPFPSTRDILLNNVKTIYEDGDYDAFRNLMTPDYLMILQQSTRDDFPSLGNTLDRDEELRIHERIFAGDPVTDPDGNLVPGISQILFDEFRQLGPWETTEASHQFPQVDRAFVQVDILFARPGFLDSSVKGMLVFYVAARDSLHEGVVQPYWQLVGLDDQTLDNKRADSARAFGAIKAAYR